MATINKVLYNVNQSTDTTITERRTARTNIGLPDVVGQPAVMDGGTVVEYGIAPLDSNGKVPADKLPSYMDDVVEGYYYNGAFYSDSGHTTAITGESGKIYVDITSGENGASYRWSGSQYTMISWQKAFGKVKVGSSTIEANDIKDTVTFAGDTDSVVTVTADTGNKKVTVQHGTKGPSSSSSTTKGDTGTAEKTPAFGGSFKVTSQTVDKYGHTITLEEHNVTLPSLGTQATNAAAGNHVHGNITNDGKILSDTNVASGHKIVTTDGNGTVSRSNLSFSNASGAGNQVMTQAGSWAQFIDSTASSSTAAAASDHGHGNITKGGTLTSSVASASSQYLVITEASNNKVARSSLAFDTANGSNKILKKTGEWGDFIGTSATTAAAGNHSHAADFGKFTHSTQETFNNANLSISSFAETIKQSSHISRNSSTGAITLDAGIYNIEYVLEVTIPDAILSNQIGQLNGVEIDYTYIHSVTVTTSTISKYTSSTAYSIDIPAAADLLSGTKIAVNQLIITYIGGIV